jgi:two-component system OmpR family sensor kinase
MRPSIARKLYYSLILTLLLLWSGAVASVVWVLQYETNEIFNSSLQETSQRLLSLVVHELKFSEPGRLSPVSEPKEHDEYLSYQLFDQNGTMLMRSHMAPDTPYPTLRKVGFYKLDNQHFYVESSLDGNYWITLAERTNHRKSTFYGTLKPLLLALGALLPLAFLAIYFAVNAMRKSILRLDHELSTRSSKDLHSINTDTLPTELFGLGETVNSLMVRLKIALEAERSFTANSAHELRTPIASAMAQLDVLRDELVDSRSQARIADAREMMVRLEQMTVKLLQLARAESGAAFNMSKMNLKSLTEMLVRDLYFRSSRRVEYRCPDQPVSIMGDVDAIGIVIQNLLENADRYASPDMPLQVEVSVDGELTIRNDCEAIADDLLKLLRKRFVRANQSK